MIHILSNDSYRGFSAHLGGLKPSIPKNTDPVTFLGRLVWPGDEAVSDVIIKLNPASSCGTANEMIGFVMNSFRGVQQPKRAALLLLSAQELPPNLPMGSNFIDSESGLCPCWATSFEQNKGPFNFVRRLPSISEKQCNAFYQSTFCRSLASVDCGTGNNDRHEGNFLYIDDLNYVAIDQGCVGGGMYWHTSWPEQNPRNQLLHLAQEHLSRSQLGEFHAKAILEHELGLGKLINGLAQIPTVLHGLLDEEHIQTIVAYMNDRIGDNCFAETCGRLL